MLSRMRAGRTIAIITAVLDVGVAVQASGSAEGQALGMTNYV
ncbi:hypothetical protein LX88_000186 [Lentzea californiensis]|nr:hypothetical protein [Lentzea californiensis]